MRPVKVQSDGRSYSTGVIDSGSDTDYDSRVNETRQARTGEVKRQSERQSAVSTYKNRLVEPEMVMVSYVSSSSMMFCLNVRFMMN